MKANKACTKLTSKRFQNDKLIINRLEVCCSWCRSFISDLHFPSNRFHGSPKSIHQTWHSSAVLQTDWCFLVNLNPEASQILQKKNPKHRQEKGNLFKNIRIKSLQSFIKVCPLGDYWKSKQWNRTHHNFISIF